MCDSRKLKGTLVGRAFPLLLCLDNVRNVTSCLRDASLLGFKEFMPSLKLSASLCKNAILVQQLNIDRELDRNNRNS